MITEEILKVYIKYHGDGDGFVRMATTKEKSLFSNTTWITIDRLIQNSALISSGLSSESFTSKAISEIEAECENDRTMALLKSIKF